MTWGERPVLVTGGSGFIGSHLVERLVGEGARVRALVHYNSRGGLGLLGELPAQVAGQVDVVAGDLLDPWSVAGAVQGSEVVFHLAALIAIPYSYRHPLHVVQTNVLGTTHVLEAARLHGVSRVLHISTSEVYGTARYVPIDEEHPLQGQSPYSASKIGAEKIAESYHRSFGLPVAVIRPFNTYGPRQSARAVIPTIIAQALTRDRVLLGSLTPTRDFTYVADIVHGLLLAADSLSAVGQVTNIGSGAEISIGDLAHKILAIVGRDVPVEGDPRRLRPEDSEVERLLCDNRLARERLGWTPGVSLEDGLRRTIEWIRQHIERYHPDSYQV
jgi:NAD dependent epimerase/dehydratase